MFRIINFNILFLLFNDVELVCNELSFVNPVFIDLLKNMNESLRCNFYNLMMFIAKYLKEKTNKISINFRQNKSKVSSFLQISDKLLQRQCRNFLYILFLSKIYIIFLMLYISSQFHKSLCVLHVKSTSYLNYTF